MDGSVCVGGLVTSTDSGVLHWLIGVQTSDLQRQSKTSTYCRIKLFGNFVHEISLSKLLPAKLKHNGKENVEYKQRSMGAVGLMVASMNQILHPVGSSKHWDRIADNCRMSNAKWEGGGGGGGGGEGGGWLSVVPLMGPTVNITKPNKQLVTHHLDSLKISVEEPTICFLNTAAPSLSGEKQSVEVNKACLLLVRSPTSREALKVWLKQIEVQGKGRIPPCQTCFAWLFTFYLFTLIFYFHFFFIRFTYNFTFLFFLTEWSKTAI